VAVQRHAQGNLLAACLHLSLRKHGESICEPSCHALCIYTQVLIPVANGSDEMEVLVTVDVLRRANADVVVASAEGGDAEVVVVARHGTRIVADALLVDAVAAGQQFDFVVVPASRALSALLLPCSIRSSLTEMCNCIPDCLAHVDQGGMAGAKTLAGTEALVALLKEHAAAGRAYGAIGAATAEVLEPHGLLELEGKKATTTCASMADSRECGSRVVVDGNLATSSGPGTAMEFALAVVEKLLGAEAAREVAEALLFV